MGGSRREKDGEQRGAMERKTSLPPPSSQTERQSQEVSARLDRELKAERERAVTLEAARNGLASELAVCESSLSACEERGRVVGRQREEAVGEVASLKQQLLECEERVRVGVEGLEACREEGRGCAKRQAEVEAASERASALAR